MVRGEKDVENNWSYYDPHGKILPYKSKLDLIKVKRTIYRKYLFLNPWAVIKVLADINFRAFKAIVTTFKTEYNAVFIYFKEKGIALLH